MIILGLDPGLATTGFGIIKQTGSRLSLLDYGTISTSAGTPMATRLKCIYSDLTTLFSKYDISDVAIEELFFNKNTKTAIAVAQARGVLLLTTENQGKNSYSYTPPEIKSGVCGYGSAIKSQVQYMVKKLLNLDTTPKPDDAADALAVAICHSNSKKLKYSHI